MVLRIKRPFFFFPRGEAARAPVLCQSGLARGRIDHAVYRPQDAHARVARSLDRLMAGIAGRGDAKRLAAGGWKETLAGRCARRRPRQLAEVLRPAHGTRKDPGLGVTCRAATLSMTTHNLSPLASSPCRTTGLGGT